jgi:general secretion pathway protein G
MVRSTTSQRTGSRGSPHRWTRRYGIGFTLIELLVVLGIVALLLTIAVPRYFGSIETAKQNILLENLRITRETIDKFYSDTGRYPDSLHELVEKRYLRALPFDPVAESDTTWVLVPPDDPDKGRIYNIRSGAPGTSKGGTPFVEW